MPIKILMPALSPTMTEGTLASWLKSEGDDVSAGDVIAEIETDKATMEVEAVDEGKLGKILIDAGTEGVPVNEVIALLLEDGEDASALDGAESAPAPAPAASNGAAAPAEAAPAEKPAAAAAPAPTAPAPE
ncbi:MAG: biotin/lipoyl-containing protein, partial [Pseudomonadota bacterium]